MTPGKTRGNLAVEIRRAPKAAILQLFCIAAYEALMSKISPQPPVSPGVIVVKFLRN
jgi:hypothetical protein